MKVKFKKALKDLYKAKGIGRTIKARLAYWESTVDGSYFMSHNPTDTQKVRIFQVCWLSDKFPADFTFY